jgi:hypothetical protein
MNISMHGRKINLISWPDSSEETGRCMSTGEKYGVLTFSATYHGDRDEFWIVQTKDGKEVARHNPRYVEMIMWAEDDA